jgi:hypothetical protein
MVHSTVFLFQPPLTADRSGEPIGRVDQCGTAGGGRKGLTGAAARLNDQRSSNKDAKRSPGNRWPPLGGDLDRICGQTTDQTQRD